MTAIPASVRHEVETRLTSIAAEEGMNYLLAIESGSRAWGFASPDSDYDIRFIYVRPRQDYLALTPPRDVVERPIVDEIDLNGWDIRKALGLMLKHNAVLSEWIESPIRYLEDDPVIPALRELIDRHFDPRGFALHYANLGKRQTSRWLDGTEQPTVKKYFYALRPALAVRCLRINSAKRPPMNLQELMDATDLNAEIRSQIDELVAQKAVTREAGTARKVPQLEELIHSELELAQEVPTRPSDQKFEQDANALFYDLVESVR